MNLSDQGKLLIKTSEGLRLMPYSDCVGKSTIGYGHLIGPTEDFASGITLAQAEQLFDWDVERAEGIVSRECKVPLTQGGFDALTDFCFNLGDRLQGSTLLRYLNAGNYAEAEAQLPNWCYAGGRPNPALRARRLLELKEWQEAA